MLLKTSLQLRQPVTKSSSDSLKLLTEASASSKSPANNRRINLNLKCGYYYKRIGSNAGPGRDTSFRRKHSFIWGRDKTSFALTEWIWFPFGFNDYDYKNIFNFGTYYETEPGSPELSPNPIIRTLAAIQPSTVAPANSTDHYSNPSQPEISASAESYKVLYACRSYNLNATTFRLQIGGDPATRADIKKPIWILAMQASLSSASTAASLHWRTGASLPRINSLYYQRFEFLLSQCLLAAI